LIGLSTLRCGIVVDMIKETKRVIRMLYTAEGMIKLVRLANYPDLALFTVRALRGESRPLKRRIRIGFHPVEFCDFYSNLSAYPFPRLTGGNHI
jgi:hypothetical protein